MKKTDKIALFCFIFVVFGSITLFLLQEKRLDNELDECSIYSVADVTKVYQLRGITYAKYKFRIDTTVINDETSVGPTDTGEWWDIDREKLRKRRLLIKISCRNFNANKVIWDSFVPDTLKFIPANGWKKIPFSLEKR